MCGNCSNLDTRGMNVSSACLGLVSLEEEGGVSIVCVRHLHQYSRPVLWVKGTHPWDPTIRKCWRTEAFYLGAQAYVFNDNAKIILWNDLFLFLSVTPWGLPLPPVFWVREFFGPSGSEFVIYFYGPGSVNKQNVEKTHDIYTFVTS